MGEEGEGAVAEPRGCRMGLVRLPVTLRKGRDSLGLVLEGNEVESTIGRELGRELFSQGQS